MKLVMGSYVLDNVTSTSYEEFITYYSQTAASSITNEDITRWNTRDDLSGFVTYSYLSDKLSSLDIDLSSYATISYVTEEMVKNEKVIASAITDLSYRVDNIHVPETDLSAYVTYSYLNSKNYLTQHQDLSDYVDNEYFNEVVLEVGQAIDGKQDKIDLSSYATLSYVTEEMVKNEKVIASAITDLSYRVDSIGSIVIPEVDLSSYVTFSYLEEKNYLTQHQDLSNYYTKDDVYNKNEIDASNSIVTDTISYLSYRIDNIDIQGGGDEVLTSYSYGYVLSVYKDRLSYVGEKNIVFGTSGDYNKQVNGKYSFIIGNKIINRGSYNFIAGIYNQTNAFGDDYITCNTLFGENNYSSYANRDRAHHTLASGRNIDIKNPYETGFGTYNLSRREDYNYPQYDYSELYPYGFSSGEPLNDNTIFTIGNGKTTVGERHNAFEVRQTGNVYIPYNTNPNYTYQHAYLFSMLCLQDFITYTYNNIGSGGGGQDLSSYVTYTYLDSKNYLTEHQDLSNYYTKTDIDNNYWLKDEVYTKNEIDASNSIVTDTISYLFSVINNLQERITQLENA